MIGNVVQSKSVFKYMYLSVNSLLNQIKIPSNRHFQAFSNGAGS